MIHIRKSKDGQFYFTVHAKNGKVLVTSETYKRKRNCAKGVRALFYSFQGGFKNFVDHTIKPKAKASGKTN